jgi:hypothetical protein
MLWGVGLLLKGTSLLFDIEVVLILLKALQSKATP